MATLVSCGVEETNNSFDIYAPLPARLLGVRGSSWCGAMRTGSCQAESHPAVVVHHGSGGCKCLGFAFLRAESLHLLRFPGLVTYSVPYFWNGVVTCPCARLSTSILVRLRCSGR